MINSLKIIGFQSHKETSLEFDKGINIITGSSDSGKTAILRAINWVVNNKPSGDEFRSNWGGETKVKLNIIKDNWGKDCIQRIKGKENLYLRQYQNSVTPSEYKAFNQDVPLEIKSILNFSPLNIQMQQDPPFMLSMSSGEVAKYLNKIVHLDVIDTSLSNINSSLREQKRTLDYKEIELKENEESLKEYSWIPEVDGKLFQLEQTQKDLEQKQKSIQTLNGIIENIENLTEQLKEYGDIEKAEREFELLKIIHSNIERKQRSIKQLSNIIDRIEETQQTLKEKDMSWKRDVKKFEELFPSVCPLCGRK